MDIRKLQKAVVDGLEDVKAQNIVVFNTEALSALFERVIIASGTSNRQTKALAASVRDSVRKSGLPVLRTEGEENGEWIIVDCGAAVVHVMQPAIREYYNLEEIWGVKPVKFKATALKGLVKAEEPSKPAKAVMTAAKAGAKTAGATKAAKPAAPSKARKAAPDAAKPVGKSVAKKAPTRAGSKTAPPMTQHPSTRAPAAGASAAPAAAPKSTRRAPVRRAGAVAPSRGTPVRSAAAAPQKAASPKRVVAKKVGKTWVGEPVAAKAVKPKTGTPRKANPHTPAPKAVPQRKTAATKRAAAPSFTGGAPRKKASAAPRKTPRSGTR